MWLDRAQKIAGAIDEWFWDESAHAYFDTARDADPLIARPRDVTDNAVPSGTSLAADLMLSLSQYAHDDARRARATWILTTMAEPIAEYPTAFGYLLGVADRAVHGAAAEFVCREWCVRGAGNGGGLVSHSQYHNNARPETVARARDVHGRDS